MRQMAEGQVPFDPDIARDAAGLAARLPCLDDPASQKADGEEAVGALMAVLAASITQGSCKGRRDGADSEGLLICYVGAR